MALTGLFLRRLQMLALSASAVFYTGYGVARLASLMVDGIPDQAMVWITLLELVIGDLNKPPFVTCWQPRWARLSAAAC